MTIFNMTCALEIPEANVGRLRLDFVHFVGLVLFSYFVLLED